MEDLLPELTRRQEEILTLVIHAYTNKREPVSSQRLVDTANLGLSSATIRNEMSVLEELGYIAAPHSSAGRIPTENGYRYFVRRLITDGELSQPEQKHIAEKFHTLPMATEQWMRFAATVLARTAQTASIVTAPIAETSRFKHLELIGIQGRLVLMVLVLQGGVVHQRMLNLAEPVPQVKLAEAAVRINTLCVDLFSNQIRMKSVQLSLLEREVAELAAELMEHADDNQVRFIYRDGLSDVIGEFADGEGTQQAVRVFEERAFLDMILADFLNPMMDGVKVIVAGEGRMDEISQLSMVLSRYGIPGQISGALGVIGPTHINYGRAISTVRYVSSVMTNMLVGLYGDEAGEAPPSHHDGIDK
ncbi:MAG: heat-inducible transcription repressor HrcA [Chitinophagaceae bacterium]|nr:heat-inducible transcription repressor HrcA [Anaerolineae bacterium]